MSGVRSLRAMFEQRKMNGDSSSPPDQQRGRTPVPDGSEYPRPLSRVRTSFIAVEKDGRIGLQRNPSRGCSRESTTRSISGDKSIGTPLSELSNAFDSAMADTPPKTSPHIQSISKSPRPDVVAPAPAPAAADPVPTSKPATETGGPVKPAGVGAVTDGPADTSPAVALSTNGKPGESVNVQVKGAGSKTRAPLSKTTKAASGTTRSVPKIDPAKATTSSKPAKSPVVTAAPKTPTDTAATAAKTSLITPDRRNVVQHTGKPTSATTTLRGRATASASATASRDESSAKKPANITTLSPPFTKPKVKSPTKPVKLPAGLVMQTAASEQRRSQSRSTARAPGSPADLWAPAAKKTTLKRQSSNINRPPPSLGPPPKLGAKDHPPTRKESEHVDEAFLERMMRPTTASSSKVHGKVLTPPRKHPASASGSEQTTPRLVKKIPPPALSSTTAAVAATAQNIAAPSINLDAPTPVATTRAEQRSPTPTAAEPANPVPAAAVAVEVVQEDKTATPAAEPSVLEIAAQETDPAADEAVKVNKEVEGVMSSQESERPKSSEEVEQTPEAEQQPTPAETVAA